MQEESWQEVDAAEQNQARIRNVAGRAGRERVKGKDLFKHAHDQSAGGGLTKRLRAIASQKTMTSPPSLIATMASSRVPVVSSH
jgi:hypothetical protein